MPPKRSIICFSINEWGDVPRNQVHLMRVAARRGYRVLYVETIGLRRPELTRRDVGKVMGRLGSLRRPLREVEKDFWLLSPLAIPVHGVAVIDSTNELLLRTQVLAGMRKLGMKDPIVWSYLPQTARFAKKFGTGPTIYFRCDEYSEYRGVDRERLLRLELDAVRRTDLSVASSARYLGGVLAGATHSLFLPNAVDGAHFGRRPEQDPYSDQKRPVLLTIGTLEHWLDVELLAGMARLRPDWSFVLAGPLRTDISALASFPNVSYVGVVDYARLPEYVGFADIGLVPFRVDPFIQGATPGKVFQFLAAGKAVVATPFLDDPELVRRIYVAANNPAAFVEAAERALKEDGSALADARRAAVASESWDARFDAIEQALVGL